MARALEGGVCGAIERAFPHTTSETDEHQIYLYRRSFDVFCEQLLLFHTR